MIYQSLCNLSLLLAGGEDPELDHAHPIDNPLVRIPLIIEMILVDRPCAMEFEFRFTGGEDPELDHAHPRARRRRRASERDARVKECVCERERERGERERGEERESVCV